MGLLSNVEATCSSGWRDDLDFLLSTFPHLSFGILHPLLGFNGIVLSYSWTSMIHSKCPPYSNTVIQPDKKMFELCVMCLCWIPNSSLSFRAHFQTNCQMWLALTSALVGKRTLFIVNYRPYSSAYGRIFQTIFKRNCKLYFQLCFQYVDAAIVTNATANFSLRLRFCFCEGTVTAKFQMEKQSPFATVFPMSYELWACHI